MKKKQLNTRDFLPINAQKMAEFKISKIILNKIWKQIRTYDYWYMGRIIMGEIEYKNLIKETDRWI